jgi:hypothetical protein
VILVGTLCGDGGDGHLLGCGTGDVAQPAFGEDVDSEVTALFGPLVVLLGQDGADQPDQRCPVGEDADDVGAAADLPVQPFLGARRQSGPVVPFPRWWGCVSRTGQPARFDGLGFDRPFDWLVYGCDI